MDIKVPSGVKNPTVIIVGGGTMSGDEKSNRMHEKRMDLLEKKLDQQYKNKIDGKVYAKDIESIQKSFFNKLDKFVNQNRRDLSTQNNKLLEALKKKVNQKVELIEKTPNDNRELKTFIKKIDSLEDAIRKISMQSKTVNVTKKVNLDSSFEKMFARFEKAIKEARPRLSPSPS